MNMSVHDFKFANYLFYFIYCFYISVLVRQSSGV